MYWIGCVCICCSRLRNILCIFSVCCSYCGRLHILMFFFFRSFISFFVMHVLDMWTRWWKMAIREGREGRLGMDRPHKLRHYFIGNKCTKRAQRYSIFTVWLYTFKICVFEITFSLYFVGFSRIELSHWGGGSAYEPQVFSFVTTIDCQILQYVNCGHFVTIDRLQILQKIKEKKRKEKKNPNFWEFLRIFTFFFEIWIHCEIFFQNDWQLIWLQMLTPSASKSPFWSIPTNSILNFVLWLSFLYL